jgi:hypothetical protein
MKNEEEILLSNIIKQVEGFMDNNAHHGIHCESCGTLNMNESKSRPCGCGKMMHPHTFDFSKWIPGYVVIRCGCGSKLDCRSFTNTCKCGRDYNFAGDELAPREFWGEETGELPNECY